MRSIILFAFIIGVTFCCVNRTTAVSRGMVWVNAHVPYSGTGSHDGYRTDCSGFASMCWQLPKPGYTTGQFIGAKACARTTKDQLVQGDFILAPNHHVTVFLSWIDSGKTKYWCMQQATPSQGTIKRQMTYPYGSSTDFFPCKVLSACGQQNFKYEQQDIYLIE